MVLVFPTFLNGIDICDPASVDLISFGVVKIDYLINYSLGVRFNAVSAGIKDAIKSVLSNPL
jgi:hypothetical protein